MPDGRTSDVVGQAVTPRDPSLDALIKTSFVTGQATGQQDARLLHFGLLVRRKLRISRITDDEEKLQVAHLLYERDRPFVPITPLAVFEKSSSFFKAAFEGDRVIRAASYYEPWLSGCDDEAAREQRIDVFELASSIVREPMGGFREPSLQQLFAFTRILDILYPRFCDGMNHKRQVCIVAAIAAQNAKSLHGMMGLGMKPIEPLPRWLQYEHRSWFPRLAGEDEREIDKEAYYLWLPPDAAEKLSRELGPYLDGTKRISRPNKATGSIEEYEIEISLREYQALVQDHGSFSEMLKLLPFSLLRPPPKFAMFSGSTF